MKPTTATFLLLALLTLILTGCGNLDADDPIVAARKAETKAAIQRCWDTGGMPTRAVWDGRFENCIYPPKPEK